MGNITVGKKTMTLSFVGDKPVQAIYLGHTLIYIYIGYQLIDSNENVLTDSNGDILMCS